MILDKLFGKTPEHPSDVSDSKNETSPPNGYYYFKPNTFVPTYLAKVSQPGGDTYTLDYAVLSQVLEKENVDLGKLLYILENALSNAKLKHLFAPIHPSLESKQSTCYFEIDIQDKYTLDLVCQHLYELFRLYTTYLNIFDIYIKVDHVIETFIKLASSNSSITQLGYSLSQVGKKYILGLESILLDSDKLELDSSMPIEKRQAVRGNYFKLRRMLNDEDILIDLHDIFLYFHSRDFIRPNNRASKLYRYLLRDNANYPVTLDNRFDSMEYVNKTIEDYLFGDYNNSGNVFIMLNYRFGKVITEYLNKRDGGRGNDE